MVNANEASLPLATPDSFSFPYELPYEIQTILMRHVYSAIEDRCAAVVESPTGTGKSLTLLCSSLTWLQDDAARSKKVAMDVLRQELEKTHEGEPRWIVEQEVKRHLDDYEANEKQMRERLDHIRIEKEKKQAELRRRANFTRKRPRLNDNDERKKAKELQDDDDRFAPDDYTENLFDDDGLTAETRALLENLQGKASRRRWAAVDEDEEPDVRKIYFTSRTHSQLSQFQNELRKTKFAETIRTIPLGSRQNLCINDKVKGGCRSVDMLNDRCLDLQKAGEQISTLKQLGASLNNLADKGKRCEFLPPVDESERLEDFRDHALSEIHSIDDLEDLGREMKVCPYYGSRKAIKQAQLVTLPYNLILQKQARESIGIDLTDNIVIVDEAHNLIDTVLSIHSVEINSIHLTFARGALMTYLKRFKTRLKGTNALYLKQLVALMSTLAAFCADWLEKKLPDRMLNGPELVKKCGADQINLRELDKYLTTSKIAQKISGYMENLEEKAQLTGKESRSAKVSAIHKIQAFILTLANASTDGRILISRQKDALHLRYQLLNPSDAFGNFEAARSVIIAGGTMAPLSDFAQQLLTFLPSGRIKTLSCAHVVPQSHILARALAVGPSGYRLEFKYEQRNDTRMLDEYGAALLNCANLVSKGLVVFVPSYASLDMFLQRWEKTGLLGKIKQRKMVFLEPKDGANTEQVLREYALAVAEQPHGAIILAVVGAKLSEGINFQDDLCRCVVVIGIPYPSSQSIELRERMKYVSSLPSINGLASGEAAGKRLYSNLAFRAVNQSIGRSIRHINDWSAIVLMDARYTQVPTQSRLPSWISENIAHPTTFGMLVKDLAGFMKSRKAVKV